MSEQSDRIREVVRSHEFSSWTTSRGGFNHHHARCSCDPELEFDWQLRHQQHLDHLHEAIFEAGRASVESVA